MRYRLGYASVAELLAERGITVDRSTFSDRSGLDGLASYLDNPEWPRGGRLLSYSLLLWRGPREHNGARATAEAGANQ